MRAVCSAHLLSRSDSLYLSFSLPRILLLVFAVSNSNVNSSKVMLTIALTIIFRSSVFGSKALKVFEELSCTHVTHILHYCARFTKNPCRKFIYMCQIQRTHVTRTDEIERKQYVSELFQSTSFSLSSILDLYRPYYPRFGKIVSDISLCVPLSFPQTPSLSISICPSLCLYAHHLLAYLS